MSHPLPLPHHCNCSSSAVEVCSPPPLEGLHVQGIAMFVVYQFVVVYCLPFCVVYYLSRYHCLNRHSIRSLMTCLRSSSPCQLPIASLSSEMMSSFLCISTSDGRCGHAGGRGRLSHVIWSFLPLLRLYPVDRSRVNEYGEAFETTDQKSTGHMKED